MTRVVLTREAENDIAVAYDHALMENATFARSLLDAVDATLKLVELQPRAYAIRGQKVRRVNFKRLPFGLLYRLYEAGELANVEGELVVVFGLMHQSEQQNRFVSRHHTTYL
ncbi:type II toxin-antitoxin system RelE/ParE family toxin [bacterium]|nr:MAG: type II toxin-antitoxin system RelE/ParE family toxin [bacterium]